jgi:5'-methylthioadenosine phosphorylase
MIIGLITGSGLEHFGFDACDNIGVETDFGRVELQRAEREGREVYLLQRHGPDHSIPPHRINYRANLMALRTVGCRLVLATNAVGSLRQAMKPGDLVVPDQFIDCTKLRATTFFDGTAGPGAPDASPAASSGVVRASSPLAEVRHVDVTEPYCGRLRTTLAGAIEAHSLLLFPAGVYVCTEGPRFETPAEIRAYAGWGGDLVGMTGVPEVVLAREVGMCYATLCLVTNFAAGISGAPITSEEIAEIATQRQAALDEVLQEVLMSAQDDPACACHQWWAE